MQSSEPYTRSKAGGGISTQSDFHTVGLSVHWRLKAHRIGEKLFLFVIWDLII